MNLSKNDKILFQREMSKKAGLTGTPSGMAVIRDLLGGGKLRGRGSKNEKLTVRRRLRSGEAQHTDHKQRCCITDFKLLGDCMLNVLTTKKEIIMGCGGMDCGDHTAMHKRIKSRRCTVELTQCCVSVTSLCSTVLVASARCWVLWGGCQEPRLCSGLDAVRNPVLRRR